MGQIAYSARMTDGLIPGGLLVAIEGIDGAGKTTLARALAADLARVGAPVVLDKEPTTGPWGAQLRASAASGRLSPAEETRLLLADRRQHVDEVITPALALGKVVILDRYYPSMVAYQGATGMAVDDILAMNAFAPPPDVTLLLDLPPAVGLARIRARGDVPNAFETEAALAASRTLFVTMPLPSRCVIDAMQDAHAVHVAAWHALLPALAEKARATLGLTPAAIECVRAIGCAAVA